MPTEAEKEAQAWMTKRTFAENAFAFWNSFLALRAGAGNDVVLTSAQVLRFHAIVRAVSWVESRHGTGSGIQPARDPMQCGNPADLWWKELTGQTGQLQSRFIGGPGAGNYNASELPDAAHATASFPAAAKITLLANKLQGHNDAAFAAVMSYYWAVPILIHKTNTGAGSADRTYKCSDVSRARLVAGAVDYNGQGVADYEQRINNAIALFGWPG